jgi:hypothetical protein
LRLALREALRFLRVRRPPTIAAELFDFLLKRLAIPEVTSSNPDFTDPKTPELLAGAFISIRGIQNFYARHKGPLCESTRHSLFPMNSEDIYEGIYQDIHEHASFVPPTNWPEKKSLLLVYGYDIPVDRFLMGLMKEDSETPRESGGRFQALAEGNRPFTQSSMRSFGSGFGSGFGSVRDRMSESASIIANRRDKEMTVARGLGKTIQYIPYTTKTQITSGMLGFMGIPCFEMPLVYRNNHSTLLRNLFEKAGGIDCMAMEITELETYGLKKDLICDVGASSWDRRALEKHMKEGGFVGHWRLLPSHFRPYM